MTLKSFGFALLLVAPVALSGCSTVKTSTPVEYASGFTFPESPCFGPDGNLYLVNYKSTVVNKITPDGKVSIVVDTGYFNNGAIFDKKGNLYIASSGGKAIYKFDTSGKLTIAAAVSGGDSLLGPNDFAWSKNGDLYFTDPRGSDRKNLIGGVHRIRPNGSVIPFDRGLGYPNGIAFSLDGKSLFVDETSLDRLLKYKVNPDGSAGEKKVFIEFPKGSVCDGMKIDSKGNLWVVLHARAEIWGISPDGKVFHTVKVPAKYSTNFVFGGRDMKTAYVTAFDGWESPIGKILKIRMPIKGVSVGQK